MTSKLMIELRDYLVAKYRKDQYKDFLVRYGFFSPDELEDDSPLVEEHDLRFKRDLVQYTLEEKYHAGIFDALASDGKLTQNLLIKLSSHELLSNPQHESKKQDKTLPKPTQLKTGQSGPSNKSLPPIPRVSQYIDQSTNIYGGKNKLHDSRSAENRSTDSPYNLGNCLTAVGVFLAFLTLVLGVATDWFGLGPASRPTETIVETSSPTSATTSPITLDDAKELLFQDDFCDADTPNWKNWNYTDDSFAIWSPEIQSEQCRLFLETSFLSTTIPWFRLYENARDHEVGKLAFTDFDMQVYTKLLDAPHPDQTRISIHFRIGPEQTSYSNYWIWVNNEQEYCLAMNPIQNGDLCLPLEINGETVHWIKDEKINPLSEGNTIRIIAYGSLFRIYFNPDQDGGGEAIGSPIRNGLISSPGGIAFGIRALESDTVRVEIRDLIIYDKAE